jgi:hypothetical protein
MRILKIGYFLLVNKESKSNLFLSIQKKKRKKMKISWKVLKKFKGLLTYRTMILNLMLATKRTHSILKR